MKALTWHGKGDIRCERVPDPTIEDDRDVIIKVTACAICGSDLHLMNGYMPTMESGDLEPLLKKILDGEIDPGFVITHRGNLEQGPELYKTFRDREDGCIKVMLRA